MKKFIYIALSVVIGVACLASLSHAQTVRKSGPKEMSMPIYDHSAPLPNIDIPLNFRNRSAPLPPKGNSGNADKEAAYAPSYGGGEIGEREQTRFLQARGPLFSALKMLEKEIRRDKVLVEGEMTSDNLKKTRVALAADLKFKIKVLEELEKKNNSSLSSAIDLVNKTVATEKRIVASKSFTRKKRRQAQRRLETNIPVKEEALALLKKEIGE
ncbi:MAG: hypothetical protein OEZ04_12725 [Nitrospinota bacterium]|nr:hypothetical protein [Nitrospinota bacterium]